MSDFSFRSELQQAKDLGHFEYLKSEEKEYTKLKTEEILRSVIESISFQEELCECIMISLNFALAKFEARPPQILFCCDSNSRQIDTWQGVLHNHIYEDANRIFATLKETFKKDYEIQQCCKLMPKSWQILDSFSIKL